MIQPSQQGRSSGGVVALIVAIGLILLFSVSGSLWGLIGMRGGGWDHWFPVFFRPMLPLGLLALLQVGLAAWVGVDASRRGMNGYLWGLLVLFTSLVGLIVYLILTQTTIGRNGSLFAVGASGGPTSAAVCPSCRAAVQVDFKACPHCGTHLTSCSQCGKSIQPGWKVCPYCEASIEG